MRIHYVFFLLLTILLNSNVAFAFELYSGALCDGDLSTKTQKEVNAAKLIGSYFSSIGEQVGTCIGWYARANDEALFVKDIDRILQISNEGRLVDSSELNSFDSHLFIAAEYSTSVQQGASARGRSIQIPPELNTIVSINRKYYAPRLNKKASTSVGCFQITPIRFGDVENDGLSELVLNLGYDIVLFSPESKEVVFSSHFWQSDVLSDSELLDAFEGNPNLTRSDAPQYVSKAGTDVLIDDVFPARKSVTKLFAGEFDGNSSDEGGFDLILWRKVFESKLKNQEQGFQRIADVLVHYTLSSGEYVLVDSEESDIKNWLSATGLTWSQGYPSLSECPGEEGQLIPEMHDPFLNDPEVLQ